MEIWVGTGQKQGNPDSSCGRRHAVKPPAGSDYEAVSPWEFTFYGKNWTSPVTVVTADPKG